MNSSVCRDILKQHNGEDDPTAYRTKLGWVVFGPIGPQGSKHAAQVRHIRPVVGVYACIQEYFNCKSLEFVSKQEHSVEDKRFLSMILKVCRL